jgi:hypothetical protein
MGTQKQLRTRRNGTRYGDKDVVNETPVVIFKVGKRRDFMTVEEIAEDVYGKPVDHIVFKET